MGEEACSWAKRLVFVGEEACSWANKQTGSWRQANRHMNMKSMFVFRYWHTVD